MTLEKVLVIKRISCIPNKTVTLSFDDTLLPLQLTLAKEQITRQPASTKFKENFTENGWKFTETCVIANFRSKLANTLALSAI